MKNEHDPKYTLSENILKKKKGSIKTPASGGLSYKMR